MFVPFDATARFADIDRTDPDTLVDRARDLARRRAALDAEEAELLATVEELRVGGVDWFRDPGAWLRVKTGIAGYTARTRLTVARGLAVLPTVLEALREGRIGFDHVRVIADQADSPNRDNLLEDIEEILGWALTKAADDFRDAVAGWARDLDERREVGMTDHQRQLRRRKVTRSRTKEGLRRTVLDLDDETDSIVYGAVRDIVADMLRAEKKADLRPETRRATRQIWADAFGELARRSRGADVITRHKARPVILAMTEMSVLRDQQRLALRAMHATCAVEGCDMDFDWCEIHHLRPWERGGYTDLDNLVPLCSYHHHLIHDCDIEPQIQPDRTLRVVPIPLTPAPQRRRARDLTMGTSPPDQVPARG